MARYYVAELIIDDSIAAKIGQDDRWLTCAEVEEVVLWSRDAVTKWDHDEVHDRRLIVRGETFQGRKVIAFLMPVDEPARIFKLKSAWPDD
jgi:hypothetical protein